MSDYRNLSLNQLLSNKNDSASWYWLGMAHMENMDIDGAIEWLTKCSNDAGNEWQNKATQELAMCYMADGHPKSNRDEALRIFEKISQYLIPQFYIGLLYYFGTETKKDVKKGREYIEKALKVLKEKGGLSHLGSYDFLRVAHMYQDEGEIEKAKEYLQITIDTANQEGFLDIREQAEKCLREL